MSGLVALLGDKLQSKDGEVATDAALAGKRAIGIYFSAHWCPPCRGFTPKLAEFYTKSLKDKGLEVVFVSSDRDEGAFGEYFGEMPWLAVPYGKRDIKSALDKKFKVQGIPTFVIIDGEGQLITKDGRAAVMQDPEGNDLPWKPKSMRELLEGAVLLRKSERTTAQAAFAGKSAIALYFSAHWCPPCRGFTPKLAEWYSKDLQAKGLEVVFVSSDKDEGSFKEYYGEQPWLALDFEDRKAKELLSNKCGVEGIPSLVILDPVTYNIINAEGRAAVSSDPTGEDLPWKPKPVTDLSGGPGSINEIPTVLVFCEACSKDVQAAVEAALKPHGQKYLDEAGEDGAEMLFMTAKSAGGIAGKIRALTGQEALPPSKHEHPLEEKPEAGAGWGCDGCGQAGAGKKRFRCTQGCDFDFCGDCNEKSNQQAAAMPPKMILIDIPSDGAFFEGPAEVTEQTVASFIADFKAGKLERKQLG
eukprot:SRR837773.17986.p2 GENE.SRR837773.17986~~SRR837773.17986.p2  ORF type:complete len:484 (-),score=259.31 SRR837773.17986:84-1499(-)